MLKPEKEQANWFVDHLLLVYNCCTTCPKETTAKFKIPSGMETLARRQGQRNQTNFETKVQSQVIMTTFLNSRQTWPCSDRNNTTSVVNESKYVTTTGG